MSLWVREIAAAHFAAWNASDQSESTPNPGKTVPRINTPINQAYGFRTRLELAPGLPNAIALVASGFVMHFNMFSKPGACFSVDIKYSSCTCLS